MDIEEEVAAELRDTFNVCGDDPGCQCEYALERSERVARHVLMPLIRRAQAKAWDEGFDAGERDVLEHETFDEPCIKNPYIEQEVGA